MSAADDHFSCRRTLPGFPHLGFMSLPAAEMNGAGPISRLPYALRALADSLLRHGCDPAQLKALASVGTTPGLRDDPRYRDVNIDFYPSRVLMQDSSGLPVLADIAALIQAAEELGVRTGEAVRIPAELVVDHAVEVDYWGTADAAARNLDAEFKRHRSRFEFLKWTQHRFPWLRVTPPGTGICHQLNLELFATVVGVKNGVAGTDSLLGTDSHTTMVNALSVFGWGVGGIEATSVLLGNPVSLPVPQVVGVRLSGAMPAGVTATDLALSLTAMLRQHALVGKIVEFCGSGLAGLSVPDRATIANMAPEYGATMGFFPADAETLAYLRLTGRSDEHVAIAESFLKAQDIFWISEAPLPEFEEILEFDLGVVRPTVAGPSRPDQKLTLAQVPMSVPPANSPAGAQPGSLQDGDIVIAAITSCTNTSNPRLLAAAGLVAEKAVARGLLPKPWIKTSLAPGSRIASGMLTQSGLQASLDKLGFELIGHGCTTCMGNSGPLSPEIATEIKSRNLSVAAILSGNRNFEGRVHPSARLSYLMSPPLVVAYALAGSVRTDLGSDPIAVGSDGRPVMLRDIWPSEAEIDAALKRANLAALAADNRDRAFDGPQAWNEISVPQAGIYPWEGEDGFIRRPPFLEPDVARPQLNVDIRGARALLMLGDAVTTDHISPVSGILPDSAAGRWLREHGVASEELASFSARRLNHDVMIRGGFANPRVKNKLSDREGGFTTLLPENSIMPVHEAAAIYRARDVPLIVIAGDRYGAGSARDWAAKVTRLLGVSAVIAENFERIHRTNLVAMGVLPLRIARQDRVKLTGLETFDIEGLPDALKPHGEVALVVHGPNDSHALKLACLIETHAEAEWLKAGGILAQMLQGERAAAGRE
ncbi:MAG: aconitate hydratase AcnA [Pseudomonadota bacterium]